MISSDTRVGTHADLGYWKSVLIDVKSSVRIGIHPHEALHPQPVVVTVEMAAPLGALAAVSGIQDVIDYDPVRDFINTWPSLPHVDLIETLLMDLVAVCFADQKVARVRAAIVKTAVFPEAAGVGAEVCLSRSEWSERYART